MDKIYIKARAKINLTLSILEKRPDNYHNLESVFQKINLYDEIWLEKIEEHKLELNTNIDAFGLEENIIYKAYYKLKEKFPNITGVRVTLNKKLPMQAGLAGGSTDCASFLIGMKKIFSLDFSEEEMVKFSASLGADVPPCLYGGVVKAKGIGEIITKFDSNLKYYLVIIKPKNIFCCTKEMFEKMDNRKYKSEIRTDKMLLAIEKKDITMLANNLYNDFEEISKDIKEITDAKLELMKNGAIGTLLAGSGSAVFGVFENKEKAKIAYKNLKEKYEAYICTSYNKRSKI